MNYPRQRFTFTFGLFLLCLVVGCTSAIPSSSDTAQSPQLRNTRRRLVFQGIPMTNESLREAVDFYLKDPIAGASVYGPIDEWDTSQVTDLSTLFEGRVDFNEAGIAKWNTGQVTDFSYLFAACRTFDQVLEWDFSSATTLEGMFNGATSFNQNLVRGWSNTNGVTNTASMFKGASSFNGNVAGFNTDSVVDMNMMFYNAKSFTGTGIEGMNVATAEQMDRMFMGASSFNGDITNWKPRRATTMQSMFEDAVSFDRDIGAGWRGQLSSDLMVTSHMFYRASSFDYKVCWTGLSPRIQASKMFCGSPASWNWSCVSNPSVLQLSESCTAADETVNVNVNTATIVGTGVNHGGGASTGFGGNGNTNLKEEEENVVLVGNGDSSEGDEDATPEMVIVGVTSQENRSSASILGAPITTWIMVLLSAASASLFL